MILFVGTVMVLLSAAITDVRRGKIPNILILILILFQTSCFTISQLVLNKPFISGGAILYRICAAAVVFFFFCAGDVKLLTFTVLSVDNSLYFLLAVFVIGAVVSVIKIFFKRPVNGRGRRVVHLALPILAAYLATFLPLWP